ncbi:MAG: ABC transporter ATP-binding protein [Phycisphaerales bacterium]|nr:ABC transporter ATP-binding protein [Phycisphaerales bacterium]
MHDRPDTPAPILELRGATVRFRVRRGFLDTGPRERTALDGVDLRLGRGESVGVVGESGSGKSTLARAALRLIPLTAGRTLLDGVDVTGMPESRLRPLRRRVQMVFQDPGGSLDPRMSAADIVAEPLLAHGVETRRAARERARRLLERCGLPGASAARRPHEFSGGQRQRIAIARAIALEPAALVCDEPTSALDVSVQARILDLLEELRRERGLAMLFISHDIAVVERLCERAVVMRAGRIVEGGATGELLGSPTQAYTRELIAAAPRMPVER